VLPARLLTASRRARIRVRVGDGLAEAAAVSGRFVSVGAPPRVTITTPAARTAMSSIEPLSLEARAFDDANRPLRGRLLTWFDGRRQIALGGSASVAPLAPGRHRIRVVARDRSGRTASDSVVVLVRAVAPRLLVKGVPARVVAGARVLRIRVAVTSPARVGVSGPSLRGKRPSWQIGSRPRRISVPVTPGRTPIRITLRAVGPGGASAVRIVVARTR
jgi:hypothetical protein